MMASLEKTVVDFQHQIINAVDTALFISLEETGWTREKAMEFADRWAEKIVKIEKYPAFQDLSPSSRAII